MTYRPGCLTWLVLLGLVGCQTVAHPPDALAAGRPDSGTTTTTTTTTGTTTGGIPLVAAARGLALDTWRSCGVRVDRTVACWGTASGGAITDETLKPEHTAPRAVPTLKEVTAIAIGRQHGCALQTDGTVRCWGKNSMGELGDGTIEDHPEGVAVAGLRDVVDVVVGGSHSCALLRSGLVRCWGSNVQAQLALLTPSPTSGGALDSIRGFAQRPPFEGPTASPIPVTVENITEVVAIAARGTRTCAIRGTERVVLCWGAADGGVTAADADPRPLLGLTGVRSLALGTNHSCALLEDGTARCWGANRDGQCSDASRENYLQQPLAVRGLAGATSIAVGGNHSCARLSTGALVCWGANGEGQLGDGSTTPRRAPTAVIGLTDVVDVAAADQHSCARDLKGRIFCWGADEMGQLGGGRVHAVATPAAVAGLTDAADVTAGSDFACARRAGGSVACWGGNAKGQLGDGTVELRERPVAALGVSGATTVRAEHQTTCAIVGGGALRCWGQVGRPAGDSDATAPARPAVLPGFSAVTRLALAAEAICARAGKAPWRCTGVMGPLGLADTGPAATMMPRAALRLADAESLVLGWDRVCGWSHGSSITCAPEAGSPESTSGLTGMTALRGHGPNLCAVFAGGFVRCSEAIAGAAPTAAELARVPALDDAIDVGVGNGFHCALRRTGAVACWGSRYAGQLGDGARTALARPQPADVPGLTGVTHLAVGGDFTCARSRDGVVRCWGGNSRGQLGNGDAALARRPVDLTAAIAAAPAQLPPTPPSTLNIAADPFCADATRLLGHKLARTSQCRIVDKSLGLYWVALEGPGLPRGYLHLPVVVVDGAPIKAGGVDSFGEHLRRIRAYDLRELPLERVTMLLEALGAFPPGMDRNSASGGRLRHGARELPAPGLKRDPFTLTLVAQLPSGGGFGGGMSGGYAPPRYLVAVLRGDASYRFRWTVTE